jgi:hypothetical protein
VHVACTTHGAGSEYPHRRLSTFCGRIEQAFSREHERLAPLAVNWQVRGEWTRSGSRRDWYRASAASLVGRVELSKWGAMSGLPDAARTIFADDFDPNTAELSDPAVQKVLN